MNEHSPRIILLLGCTASGKSAVSMNLAPIWGADILCVDSMQIYRGMDIGTAKPTQAECRAVSHHLIDVADPSESFSVARYVELADRVIGDVLARGRTLIIVGGTPLYMMGLMYGMFEGPSADANLREILRQRAAREGTAALHAELAKVDPEAASRIHVNDLKRIERALEVYQLTGRRLSDQQTQWGAPQLRYPATVVGIRRDKEDLSRRINARVHAMIAQGLVDEVKSLLARPGGMGTQARQGLGYAQIISHLSGERSLEDAIEQIKIQTRRFAKHQRTWFRKFQMTRWLDVAAEDAPEVVAERVASLL
jgi:tRNA dimethylallyltransferase